ncbi:L10-interacting MYB domain-containing protein [Salix suchowensis]|nr:L10-interacting MYB domain-containing protein [Salix suchowensis]
MLHIFCDLCIKAIDMGMRPNTYFDKSGWKFISTSFKEKTGHAFTKMQFKNKWDGCKKDWRIWMKLIAETGVGWSNELGTITASDEWWRSKIQEIRGAKTFRHAGIEPSLKFKFDRMFSGVSAIRQYAWAPSSGPVGANEDDLETFTVGLEGADLEEGSGDSEENVNYNNENRTPRGVGKVYMSSSSNIKSSGKRKEREHPVPRAMDYPQFNSLFSGVLEDDNDNVMDRVVDHINCGGYEGTSNANIDDETCNNENSGGGDDDKDSNDSSDSDDSDDSDSDDGKNFIHKPCDKKKLITCMAGSVNQYYFKYIHQEPCMVLYHTGMRWLTDILRGHWSHSVNMFRMDKDTLLDLCNAL